MTISPVLNQEIFDDLVQRIVQAVHPRRIVLFGSAARGQMGPHSDLDVLVVMPDGVHRRETARRIYRALSSLGVAKDVVVVTESDVRRFADEPSLVICSALKEGGELYCAA
jgi:predicted nucleotidyltransferase